MAIAPHGAAHLDLRIDSPQPGELLELRYDADILLQLSIRAGATLPAPCTLLVASLGAEVHVQVGNKEGLPPATRTGCAPLPPGELMVAGCAASLSADGARWEVSLPLVELRLLSEGWQRLRGDLKVTVQILGAHPTAAAASSSVAFYVAPPRLPQRPPPPTTDRASGEPAGGGAVLLPLPHMLGLNMIAPEQARVHDGVFARMPLRAMPVEQGLVTEFTGLRVPRRSPRTAGARGWGE